MRRSRPATLLVPETRDWTRTRSAVRTWAWLGTGLARAKRQAQPAFQLGHERVCAERPPGAGVPAQGENRAQVQSRVPRTSFTGRAGPPEDTHFDFGGAIIRPSYGGS